jgi:hypothetical protein
MKIALRNTSRIKTHNGTHSYIESNLGFFDTPQLAAGVVHSPYVFHVF